MKKYFLVLLGVLFVFSSCKTPLYLADITSVKNQPIENTAIFANHCADVEFIGTKGVSKNHPFIKFLGNKLEKSGLARNSQMFYSGLFSIEDINAYHSKCRYVTYLDLSVIKYMTSDDIDYNDNLEFAGIMVMSLTLFTLIPVYVPMLCCANKNTCQIDVEINGNIIVYDTEKKEIVYTIPIFVSKSDYLKGKYYHKKTDRDAIDKYYLSLFDAAVFQGYATLYDIM